MTPFYQSPLYGDTPYKVSYRNISGFDAHWHGELELLYLADGEAVVTVEGADYAMKPDSLIIVGCTEVHSVTASSGDSHFLLLEFSYALLGSDFSVFCGQYFPEHCYRLGSGETDCRFRRLLRSIIELLREKDGTKEEEDSEPILSAAERFRIQSCLFGLADILLSCFPIQPLPPERQMKTRNMLNMQKLCDYLRSNYQKKLPLGDAAALFGYERTRFCYLFRTYIGVPFHRYLNGCRIDAAKQLLCDSTLTIQEIAEACGFSEMKTFTRVFRSFTNEVPSVYRRRLSSESGESDTVCENEDDL